MKSLALICLLLLAACGGDKSSKKKSGSNEYEQQQNGVNFDCNFATCDSATQYCLLTMKKGTYASTNCVEKKETVFGCFSAKADAALQSKNCSGIVSCYDDADNSDVMTVTCLIP